MITEETKIMSKNGLHIRPASRLVKEAKKFISDIKITLENKTVNAKSLFKLQTLELTYGKIIKITAEGKDEKKAVYHLKNFISKLH
ncbi:HPr family phosphocarrier protein [Buchnera aphidicola (Ceratoglyphina bambusae)]|uniref:HPr family phosphocarrier protein n=1 Tax=Buchnera aphidicola TaxID=9 RepID=UPI0031B8A135